MSEIIQLHKPEDVVDNFSQFFNRCVEAFKEAGLTVKEIASNDNDNPKNEK